VIATTWGPIQVLCIGSVLCFYSGIRLFQQRKWVENK